MTADVHSLVNSAALRHLVGDTEDIGPWMIQNQSRTQLSVTPATRVHTSKPRTVGAQVLKGVELGSCHYARQGRHHRERLHDEKLA